MPKLYNKVSKKGMGNLYLPKKKNQFAPQPERASAVEGVTRDVPTVRIPVTSDPLKMNSSKNFTTKPKTDEFGNEYVESKPNPRKAMFPKGKKRFKI